MLRNIVLFLLFLPMALLLIPILLGFGALLVLLFIFFGVSYALGVPISVKKDGQHIGYITRRGFFSRKRT